MGDSDRRLTPEWLLEPVREFFGGAIPFDCCTEASNPTCAGHFCSLEADDPSFINGGLRAGSNGLAIDWNELEGTWVQPPFSNMNAWVAKAVAEANHGAEILFLSRADVRTKWFRLLADNCDMRCNINRSVGFKEALPDGSLKQLSGDFYGYCIWYFGRRRRRFERLFSPLGEVLAGRGLMEIEEAAQ